MSQDERDLRKRVTKLAYENPDLRGKLLPLLKQAKEKLATRAVAEKLAKKVKSVVDALADLEYDAGTNKASKLADKAAEKLKEGHKQLVLMGRNL